MPSVDDAVFNAYRHDPDLWASDQKLIAHWCGYYVAIFRSLGADGDIEACADAIYRVYNSPGIWKLYPDVLPALQALHDARYTIGVISDWSSALPAKVLLPLGVGPYIDFVVASATLRQAKPGSGLYRAALERAGVQAHEAVHVGDNYVTDILGARSAGIDGILLDRDRGCELVLDCPCISSLRDLPDLVARMAAAPA